MNKTLYIMHKSKKIPFVTSYTNIGDSRIKFTFNNQFSKFNILEGNFLNKKIDK